MIMENRPANNSHLSGNLVEFTFCEIQHFRFNFPYDFRKSLGPKTFFHYKIYLFPIYFGLMVQADLQIILTFLVFWWNLQKKNCEIQQFNFPYDLRKKHCLFYFNFDSLAENVGKLGKM